MAQLKEGQGWVLFLPNVCLLRRNARKCIKQAIMSIVGLPVSDYISALAVEAVDENGVAIA